MSPPRIGSSSSAVTSTCVEPEPTTSSNTSRTPAPSGEPNRSTIEPWSPGAKPGLAQERSTHGPTSSQSRHDLEAQLELQEAALSDLTPVLTSAAKNKGRIDGFSFIGHDQEHLIKALRRLSPEQCEAVAREGVQRAFPKATPAEVETLTKKTMHELRSITASAMNRELKDFIADKISTGAASFRDVAKDPAKLAAVQSHLATLTGAEREQAMQALGLEPKAQQPTAAELARALIDRAALMDRSAKRLHDTDGADATLFRLSSYPGVAAAFAKEKHIEPGSIAGQKLAAVDSEAKHEKHVRQAGDLVLAVASTIAFAPAVAIAGTGAVAAIAVASPATVSNLMRRAGAEENAVNDAKAGSAAGVMGRDAISAAESHQKLVVGAGVVEVVMPGALHLVGVHGVGPELAGTVGVNAAELALAPHANQHPTLRPATEPSEAFAPKGQPGPVSSRR